MSKERKRLQDVPDFYIKCSSSPEVFGVLFRQWGKICVFCVIVYTAALPWSFAGRFLQGFFLVAAGQTCINPEHSAVHESCFQQTTSLEHT